MAKRNNSRDEFNTSMRVRNDGIDHDAMDLMRNPGSKRHDPVTWELMQEWGVAPPMIQATKALRSKGPSPQEAQAEAMERKRAFVETAMGKEARRQTKLREKYEKAKAKAGEAEVEALKRERALEVELEVRRLRWKAATAKDRVAKEILLGKATELEFSSGLKVLTGKEIAKLEAKAKKENRPVGEVVKEAKKEAKASMQHGVAQGKASNMDALARAAARLLEEQR